MDEDKKQLTLGSLFDGIAGFPLAAAGLGIKTIWTSEIEPNCVEIAARHFPEAKQLGDITKLNGADINPVDIISFGSPCQNLSTAGNQRGLDGEKSQLFFEAVRIVYEMRGATNGKYPKYIIWENVAGAFSSNKGQDFRRVLEEITKTYIPMPNSRRWAAAGMVRSRGGSTAWRMLDAQYWGVPQRRKRIYLVHSFGNDRAGQILFECESVFRDNAQGRAEGQDASPGVRRSTAAADSGSAGELTFDLGSAADRVQINAQKSVTLKATDGGGGAATGLYLLPVYTIAGNAIGRNGRNGGNQLGIGQDVSYTLTAADRHCVAVPECEAYRLSGYGDYKEGVGTLRASGGDYGGGSETMIAEKKLQFAEAYQHHGYRISEVCFDDFVTNEDGSCWAYICKECAEKYGISESLLDDGCGGGTCGVQGCENEADFYIDFPKAAEGPAENESIWRVALDTLKGIGWRIVYRIRRLTPTECERLDGFPDGWTQQDTKGNVISDNARYMALGNSIAVPCAVRVFRGIMAVEAEVAAVAERNND